MTRILHELTGRLRRLLATLIAFAALGMIAGCSVGSDSDSASGGGSEPASASDSGADLRADAPSEAGGSTLDDGGDSLMVTPQDEDGGTPAGRPALQTRQVISTGRVALEAKELAEVRSELDRLLGRFGGQVAEEKTSNDEDGETTRSVLVLRVPSRHFDQVMAAFDDFATVTDAGREAVDVTTEVIDVDARIRTQEVSLQRLRRFLGEAATLDETIRLEAEIARREADLSSLRAQQRYLDDQTSMATINVSMTRTGEKAGPKDDSLEDAGFLTGLSKGWEALLGALVVTATIVGALLPFAVVLLVLGLPVWLFARSARRRRTPVPPPAEA